MKICTLSRPACFYKPLVVAPRQLVRYRKAGQSKVVKLCYTSEIIEVDEVAEEIETTVQEKSPKDPEIAEERRINSIFRKIKNPTNWLLSLQSEQSKMTHVNISVAATVLRQLTAQFQKEFVKMGKPETMLTEQTKYIDCFLALFPLLEKSVSEFSPKSICSTIKCVNLGGQNFQLDTKYERFHNLLNLFLEQAVKTQEEFYATDLLKLLYVSSFHYDQHRDLTDKLFEKAVQFETDEFDRYDCQDMVQILANIDSYNVEYCNEYINQSLEKYFEEKNRLFIIKFVDSVARLRFENSSVIQKVKQFLEEKQSGSGITLRVFAKFASYLSDKQEEKKNLVNGIIEIVEEKGVAYWVEDLVQILYYVASTKPPPEKIELIKNILVQKLENQYDTLSPEELRFLRWAQLFSDLQNISIEFPQELNELCQNEQKQFIQNQIEQIRGNAFVTEVFDAVKGRYPEAECGVAVSDGEMLVSILLDRGENKFAIEPLSGSQFTKNENQDLVGLKQSELDVLSNMGYKVVPVSELKWTDNMVYQEEIIDCLQ